MKNNFFESHLEEATLEWFEELGYEIIIAPDIAPEGYSEVILSERLKDALIRINPKISSSYQNRAIETTQIINEDDH